MRTGVKRSEHQRGSPLRRVSRQGNSRLRLERLSSVVIGSSSASPDSGGGGGGGWTIRGFASEVCKAGSKVKKADCGESVEATPEFESYSNTVLVCRDSKCDLESSLEEAWAVLKMECRVDGVNLVPDYLSHHVLWPTDASAEELAGAG